ncbi:hypothetical protein HDU93_003581 [Gonapodya sp. JEL0774]|nr:hypothetical protein HDU93_003581 [Gonapodya sp. JEL0774]
MPILSGFLALNLTLSAPRSELTATPQLVSVVSKNQLAVFLVVRVPLFFAEGLLFTVEMPNSPKANVLTGAVNLTVDTLTTSDYAAIAILSIYMLLVCIVAKLWDVFRSGRTPNV